MDTNKKIALINTFANTAQSIVNISKAMPVTKKSKRNIFLKTYLRRPLNKQKRTSSINQILMTSLMAATQARVIISQPSLKRIEFEGEFGFIKRGEMIPLTFAEQVFMPTKRKFLDEFLLIK